MLHEAGRVAAFAFLVVSLGLAISAPAATQSVQSTPGTIAQFGVPAGFEFQYDPTADSVVLLEPGRRQLVVFAWAPGDEAQAVGNLLSDLGAPEYSREIRPATIAGVRGAEVRVDAGGGSKDWIAAIARDGMLVGIWGKTAGDYDDLAAPVEALLRSLHLEPPIFPSNVIATYQTASDSSIGWSGDGFSSSEYVTLHPDGVAERRSDLGGSVGSVDVSGRSSQSARWEVRGNRLLFYRDGEFLNYRVQVFGNGLELFDQQGYEDLWVRQ